MLLLGCVVALGIQIHKAVANPNPAINDRPPDASTALVTQRLYTQPLSFTLPVGAMMAVELADADHNAVMINAVTAGSEAISVSLMGEETVIVSAQQPGHRDVIIFAASERYPLITISVSVEPQRKRVPTDGPRVIELLLSPNKASQADSPPETSDASLRGQV